MKYLPDHVWHFQLQYIFILLPLTRKRGTPLNQNHSFSGCQPLNYIPGCYDVNVPNCSEILFQCNTHCCLTSCNIWKSIEAEDVPLRMHLSLINQSAWCLTHKLHFSPIRNESETCQNPWHLGEQAGLLMNIKLFAFWVSKVSLKASGNRCPLCIIWNKKMLLKITKGFIFQLADYRRRRA